MNSSSHFLSSCGDQRSRRLPEATSSEELPTSATVRLCHAAEHLEEVYEVLMRPVRLHGECAPAAVLQARYFACQICTAVKELSERIDSRYGRPKLRPQKIKKGERRSDTGDHHPPCQQCEVVRKPKGRRRRKAPDGRKRG